MKDSSARYAASPSGEVPGNSCSGLVGQSARRYFPGEQLKKIDHTHALPAEQSCSRSARSATISGIRCFRSVSTAMQGRKLITLPATDPSSSTIYWQRTDPRHCKACFFQMFSGSRAGVAVLSVMRVYCPHQILCGLVHV